MSPMFVPGPVDVADEVLAAQTRPMLPHRSKEFEVIFKRAEEKSRNLFQTRSRVIITASSGSGLLVIYAKSGLLPGSLQLSKRL